MNDLYIRDNPARVDPPDDDRRQKEYDRQCVECVFCHKPIRPYEDPYCYPFYYDGDCLHKECKSKMVKSMRNRLRGQQLFVELFDIMEEAFEQYEEIKTPEPAIGGY